MIEELVARTRSYRRFDESKRIPQEVLVGLVDTARNVGSAGNRQPLKYAVVSGEDACAQLFPACSWAAALKDWKGPEAGERPTGYIVIMVDAGLSMNERFSAWDTGIAAQTMMLAANEQGFGGCMLAAFSKKRCAQVTGLDPERYEPALVLALGVPVEDCRLADVPESGDVAYWRDENRVHHVPKRPLQEVLLARL